MLTAEQVEMVFAAIEAMDRATVMGHFHVLQAHYHVDLSPEHLEEQSDDQLRQSLIALCLQIARAPAKQAA